MEDEVKVSRKGADRWVRGHPWIFASDVTSQRGEPGVVVVSDPRGKTIGRALYSPRSEIRLRLLDPDPRARIDLAWWVGRINAASSRRAGIDATAFRLVHAEGDALPSLIVDRYDRWLVAQVLSAGLDRCLTDVVAALTQVHRPEGILFRNDVAVRRREGLAEIVTIGSGEVPREIEVREGLVRFWAAPWTGQKTGAFLDQRPNRIRAGALVPEGGRALDCFSYHGSFALHLARNAGQVIALDESADALARGAANAELNGLTNIEWTEADAFDILRRFERARERFDLVVVDPPAFAKTRSAVTGALRGYREVNLRAMRITAPGGFLLTASCSFHVRRSDFLEVLMLAAADSGRRVTVIEHLGQGSDHPEVITIPETGYLKGAILRID